MTSFWSLWIIILTSITIIGSVWILIANRKTDKKIGETTGHIYDGIEEYDNPLPMWWFYMFVALTVFSIGYLILFPGMGSFKGILNWSSQDQLAEETQEREDDFKSYAAQYLVMPAAELAEHSQALKMGRRIYKSYCASCHGADAVGYPGFPNLTDNDWLYGGDEQSIKHSIRKGRQANMLAFEQVLGDNIPLMAEYVQKLGQEDVSQHPMATTFQQQCSVCHGSDGLGNQALGAPNLTDDIWLYGGDTKTIIKTLTYGRAGQMPAHETLITEERIHLLTGYILSLSNTEDTPNP